MKNSTKFNKIDMKPTFQEQLLIKTLKGPKLEQKLSKTKMFRAIVPEKEVLEMLNSDLQTKPFPKLKFCAGAKSVESFLNHNEKEVAFIGRSNVGKSILINKLYNSGLAKVKDEPGVTNSINWYYSLNYVVDMPGYGFAYQSMETIESWKKMVACFIQRKQLQRLFVVIDGRHGLKKADFEFLNLVPSIRLGLVMTKIDLVTREDAARRYQVLRDQVSKFAISPRDIFLVSSTKELGLGKLRDYLLKKC